MSRRRKLGRYQSFYVNPLTQDVVATFEGGVMRTYREDEIAAHAVEVAAQAVNDPNSVYEPWYEFLRAVIGEETMTTLLAQSALLGKQAAPPPGLHMEL